MFTYNAETNTSKFVPAESKAETKVVLSHRITHVNQFSNAWLIKCGCGDVFTGKGHGYPIAVRKHLHETAVSLDA